MFPRELCPVSVGGVQEGHGWTERQSTEGEVTRRADSSTEVCLDTCSTFRGYNDLLRNVGGLVFSTSFSGKNG